MLLAPVSVGGSTYSPTRRPGAPPCQRRTFLARTSAHSIESSSGLTTPLYEPPPRRPTGGRLLRRARYIATRLVNDFLSIAYDAATLATVAPDAEGLSTIAENGGLSGRIIADLDGAGYASLTSMISAACRVELDAALGRMANAADYIEGQGWEAVVLWVVDVIPPAACGLEL
jgi:hypothetical protein